MLLRFSIVKATNPDTGQKQNNHCQKGYPVKKGSPWQKEAAGGKTKGKKEKEKEKEKEKNPCQKESTMMAGLGGPKTKQAQAYWQ